MKILGIGGSDHDFSAAIMDNGVLRMAIEDERINRIKYGRGEWHSIPTQPAVDYCLNNLSISIDQIDLIYANKHLEKRAFAQNFTADRIMSHHLSHASCVFFASPFEKATIVVVDGSGNRIGESGDMIETETVSIGRGEGNRINLDIFQKGRRHQPICFWRYVVEDSIGCFYQVVSEILGFGSRGAGITMGLAPYGRLNMLPEMKEFVSIDKDGRFHFTPYEDFLSWAQFKLENASNAFQTRANIAAAAQTLFEEAILSVINHAYQLNPDKNLCYSGGCALNSVANYKILQESPFENLFLHPACSDQGNAIGAAYYAYYHDLKNPRTPTKQTNLGKIAYTGKEYSSKEIETALEQSPVFYYQPPNLIEEAAFRLSAGEVIGWFQGRSEIGPRSLGNRSILADATNPKMRDYINLNIKFRDTFRPLAPIVTVEESGKFFEIERSTPFMLIVTPVKKQFRHTLHSISHIDGSARIQTVDSLTNPRLHNLLNQFKKIKGYPILINTSFNVKGEPIVETPVDALRCFLKTKLDTLIMGDFIVEKHTPWAKRSFTST